MEKITKKRNDLKFCNDLPCNDLYVSTVNMLQLYTVETYKSLRFAIFWKNFENYELKTTKLEKLENRYVFFENK